MPAAAGIGVWIGISIGIRTVGTCPVRPRLLLAQELVVERAGRGRGERGVRRGRIIGVSTGWGCLVLVRAMLLGLRGAGGNRFRCGNRTTGGGDGIVPSETGDIDVGAHKLSMLPSLLYVVHVPRRTTAGSRHKGLPVERRVAAVDLVAREVIRAL